MTLFTARKTPAATGRRKSRSATGRPSTGRPNPSALLRWFFGFPGYLLPWNMLYAIAAILIWTFLTPSLESMATFAPWWVGLILLRNIVLADRRLWGLAPLALCLAETGHELQIQSPVAEGDVVHLRLRPPDAGQHVPHAGQRCADLDRLRGAAALGLCQRLRAADHLCRASGLVRRDVLPGAVHPRGRLLFRPPLHALAAALPGRAQLCITATSIPARGRACRCIRSSTSSTSRRSSCSSSSRPIRST